MQHCLRMLVVGPLDAKVDCLKNQSWISKKLIKIYIIDASFYKRSPFSKFFLTATLFPRLRVDNGMKIWYCINRSIHVQLLEELYQAFSRPTPLIQAPSFSQAILPHYRPRSVYWWKHRQLGLSHCNAQELTDRLVQIDP
ncbi:uncharacterized protein BJ212DRAFT_660434 [Suillus subaureus]|uniref:Translation initiation factor beta propellor-like domain-containing protein n=1 Tax=Suillus subaureus TaxID=48587 RepID=A0A9P7DIL6_9AGAM|nr:uncharacterized protein BJ212DRAFT_660434 [Suillus subaureus]KAG1794309.1 hypothetical protein BJ212DRAFT_660434 [Suillus subaureus]